MFRDTSPMTPALQAGRPDVAVAALAGLSAPQQLVPARAFPSIPSAVAPRTEKLAPVVSAGVVPQWGDVNERRFALHDIADDRGQVQVRDLLYRADSRRLPTGAEQDLDRVSLALSNALLDGQAAGCLPQGRLLLAMNETSLCSPLAEAVTADIGAITLHRDLPISTRVLMRVAQLRASGVRFGMAGVRSETDPHWLLAPYSDTFRLDLSATPPDRLPALVERADTEGLEVIGVGVQSMLGYQRLSGLAVTLLQGPFIAAPQEMAVAALPGCDAAVLQRAQGLLHDRVSFEAVAVAAAADPALVMRLHLLHRLYGAGRGAEPASLAGLLKGLPPGVLSAWMEILRRSACHDHHRGWAHSVRQQTDEYRQALHRRSNGQDHAAIQASLWIFLKRLTQPSHYLKTLRYAT
ncbi:hypothetical protein SAMN05216359_10513 [Roseateles sp. YR242]|uniref:hypothetical protein n=1 Tax=Roseateles sp. YR242 TaxID=1855305 RepID=UPI0008B1E7E1|nr:hypothetical protein [Roseateles sp. YR242]SEL06411.1 hypothetical protein SAMN05216359_10513 [Roseateles sp. YR242]